MYATPLEHRLIGGVLLAAFVIPSMALAREAWRSRSRVRYARSATARLHVAGDVFWRVMPFSVASMITSAALAKLISEGVI